MWIYPVFLLATALFVLYKYLTRNFDYWKKRNIFYIKPIPFFGNTLAILNSKKPLGESLLQLCNAAGNRDYFGFFVFDRPILMVTSPKLVREVLQKGSYNFLDRSTANYPKHPIMSNALFVQRNPVWKDHRAKLSPIFTSGKLKLMFPIMVKESEEMNEYISTIANIPDVESKEIFARFSTNVITKCAFAVDANSFKNDNAIFRQLGRQMFDFRIGTALRQIGAFFAPELINKLNIPFFDLTILDSLQDIFLDVLKTRRASKNLKGQDFVDILIDTSRTSGEEGLSENAMLGQAIQFFAAGFETVSATLSFSIYELCINPDMQEKLRNEINESLKKHNGFTYDTLHEMNYLDMCISETLRKYPPVPFLERMCKEDYKVPDSNLVIGKGIPVYIPVTTLHSNPKYFPNPEKYDPERFADKTSVNQDGLWYVPFGEGPRICIGLRFGLIEAKIGLISILSKYRIEKSAKTPIPLKYARSLTLQSEVGIPVRFVPI